MSVPLRKPLDPQPISQPILLKPQSDHHSAPVRNTRELMNLLMEDARNPKTKAVVRASLARSFAILCETLRVLQGKPSPGQLRPDLDPVQLSRALKRMKSRKPILDIGGGGSGPSEEPAATPATPAIPTEKPAKVQAAKTPLQTTGLTPKPKDPLDKPPIEERVEPSKASEQSNEDLEATKE